MSDKVIRVKLSDCQHHPDDPITLEDVQIADIPVSKQAICDADQIEVLDDISDEPAHGVLNIRVLKSRDGVCEAEAEQQQPPLKMYILIKDSVDLGHAILGAAHASLGGYLTFTSDAFVQEYRGNADWSHVRSDTEEWAEDSFRKVVCGVTDELFDSAKVVAEKYGLAYRAMQECALGDGDISLVFAPRREWPKFFKFLGLYK